MTAVMHCKMSHVRFEAHPSTFLKAFWQGIRIVNASHGAAVSGALQPHTHYSLLQAMSWPWQFGQRCQVSSTREAEPTEQVLHLGGTEPPHLSQLSLQSLSKLHSQTLRQQQVVTGSAAAATSAVAIVTPPITAAAARKPAAAAGGAAAASPASATDVNRAGCIIATPAAAAGVSAQELWEAGEGGRQADAGQKGCVGVEEDVPDLGYALRGHDHFHQGAAGSAAEPWA